jgi:hypothetical protein
MLANHPERGWAHCRCSGLFETGAVLVLSGPPWPRYESERQLVIALDGGPSASSGQVVVTGAVRDVAVTECGWLRVDVTFANLTAEQRDHLNSWSRSVPFWLVQRV